MGNTIHGLVDILISWSCNCVVSRDAPILDFGVGLFGHLNIVFGREGLIISKDFIFNVFHHNSAFLLFFFYLSIFFVFLLCCFGMTEVSIFPKSS